MGWAPVSSLKILIVAPNVSAVQGGEAILPLHYFRLLSRRGYAVHLIAHERNRAELTARPDCDSERMHFVPDTRWHKLIWRVAGRLPSRIGESIGAGLLTGLNEVYQARIIRRLVAEGRVDVIHQPIPVSPLAPSNLHRFKLPLVIGPMNGGMNFPPGYEDLEGRASRRSTQIGRFLAYGLNRAMPGKHRAARLLVANERTWNALPDPRHPCIEMLVENAVEVACWNEPQSPRHSMQRGWLRLVFVGRFVRFKAIDFTLRALALSRARGVNVTLDLVGDGGERPALEALTRALGLEPHVTFHGFLPQSACAEVMSRTDALVLNSLCECGGAVVLEAMAMGMPVIASAWGGPMDYVTPESGILVDPLPREDFVGRLADAIVRLADDPDARRRMGQAGREIVRRDYDWEAKIDRIVAVYASAVASAGLPDEERRLRAMQRPVASN